MKRLEERNEAPTLEGFKYWLMDMIEDVKLQDDEMKDKVIRLISNEIIKSNNYDYSLMDFDDPDWAEEDFNGNYESLFTLKLDDNSIWRELNILADNPLITWLQHNSIDRLQYMDDAITQGEATGFIDAMSIAQFHWYREGVYYAIEEVEELEY